MLARTTFTALAIATVSGTALAQERFFFDLCGPTRVVGEPGELVTASVRADIRIEGIPGGERSVAAWSMAIGVDGGARVSGATTPFEDADYVHLSATPESRGEGVILGVVLDFALDGELAETLPPENSPHEVLRFDVDAVVPDSGTSEVTLEFVDGLVGEGLPVSNIVVFRVDSASPVLDSMPITFTSSPCEDIAISTEPSVASATLNPCHPAACFRIPALPPGSPEVGKPLVVSLSGADVDNVLLFRWGAEPTFGDYDFVADAPGQAFQTIIVPATRSEDAFVRAVSDVAGGNVTIDVSTVITELAVSRVFPRVGGMGQSIRFLVEGTGFRRGESEFRLRHGDSGVTIAARPGGTTILSAGRAEVTFDFVDDTGVNPLGLYDLEVVKAVNGTTLRESEPDVFELREKSPREEYELDLDGPQRYRAHRLSSLAFNYTNATNLDLPPPLFLIEGPSGTRLRLAREAAFPSVSAGRENRLLVLAVNEGEAAGRLSPYESGSIPVEFTSDRDIDLLDATSFRLRRFVPENAIGLELEWPDTPLTGVAADDWNRFTDAAATRTAFGDTWATFHDHLVELTSQLGRRGKDSASVLELFRFAFERSLADPGRGFASVRGTLVNEDTGDRVPGALLHALDGEGAVVSCGLSNDDGEFVIDRLHEGATYAIAVRDHAVLEGASVTLPQDVQDLFDVAVAVTEAETERLECPLAPEGLPLETPVPPDMLFVEAGDFPVEFVRPRDPNEKNGPVKAGGRGLFVDPAEPVHYTIYFENKRSAQASAQRVEVVDELPPSFDWRTVCFGSVRFGDVIVQLREVENGPDPISAPPVARLASSPDCAPDDVTPYIATIQEFGSCGRRFVSTLVRVRHELDDLDAESPVQEMAVSIEALVEPVEPVESARGPSTARLRWILEALDPETLGPLPDDPLAGLLPPNNDCHRGEGSVSFHVMARPNRRDGTVARCPASITFDNLETILVDPDEVIFCNGGHAAAASSPYPADGAVGAPSGVVFQWSSECRADFFDVEVREVVDDGSGNVEHVLVDRTTEEEPLEMQSTSPVGVTGLYRMRFRPEGLRGGASYVWRVATANSREEPAWWSFTTAEPDSGCPGQPTGLEPDSGACSGTELTWQAVPGAASYAIYMGSVVDGGPTRLVAEGVEATSYPLHSSDFTPTGDEIDRGAFTWRVVAMNANCPTPESGTASEVATFRVCRRFFVRGDCNADGEVNISDVLCTLRRLFSDPELPPPCIAALNANDETQLDLSDAVYVLNFLFSGGPPPEGPFPDCDRAELGVDCAESSPSCATR